MVKKFLDRNSIYAVFLDEDLSTIKLGDWGFATLYEPEKYLATACGSLDYSAPEILSGKCCGPEVDVWSLGQYFSLNLDSLQS